MKLPAHATAPFDLQAEMLTWVARGWSVFPLAPRSKEPIAKSKGSKDATRDPRVIAAWAAEYPDANIGGICDKWLVVDIDPRTGGTRPDDLPPTRVHMSGRGDGGQHLIYRLPPDADCKSGKLATGVDIKTGAGSYVVLPPSIHPDTGWSYVAGTQAMAIAPPALVSRFARDGSVDTDGDASTGGSRSMLSALLDRPVSEGGRNDWLTAVSGHFAKMHRDKKDLFESQVRMANQTLPSPLGDREVAKIMKSIWESERTNNADRDQIAKLSADNGHLIAHGDRLMTLGWPDGAPKDAPAELVEFADFNPEVINVMIDPEDDMYIYDVRLRRASGPPVVVTIAAESFGDPRALRKVLARYAASVTHPKRLAQPTPDWATRLLKYLVDQDAPRLTKAPYLGWDDTENGYLTLDGVLDGSGLRAFRQTKPNTVELRQSAPVDHGYRLLATRARAVDILAQVCTFQDEETVAIFGAWWAATLAKSLIRRHTAMFPVMAIEAASGSGKTSGFFALMIQLIGSNDGAGQYTLATLRNALSANSNNVIWVDDLDDPSTLHELIRVLTAGGSLSKMVNHTKTMRYPLVSSLLLSGESLGLQDQKATLDRCVVLHPPDPTRRRSVLGDYPQWDDIAKLSAELHSYGGGSGLSGHYAQMVAGAAGQIRQLCEQMASSMPSGRTGSWHFTLAVGARVLDFLTTNNRAMLTDQTGPHAATVDDWLVRRMAPVTDDAGNERIAVYNDNALTQKILPAYLADVSINPTHRSPIASAYEREDGYEVLVNLRALATWWSEMQRGRIHPRTESESSFVQQITALKNAYPGHVGHVRHRLGSGSRLRRFVSLTGPIAREIVLRSQD